MRQLLETHEADADDDAALLAGFAHRYRRRSRLPAHAAAARSIDLPRGGDRARLRLQRAHRSRPSLPRREGQRPHRAAEFPAGERRSHRDPDGEDHRAAPRLAVDAPRLPRQRTARARRCARWFKARSRANLPPAANCSKVNSSGWRCTRPTSRRCRRCSSSRTSRSCSSRSRSATSAEPGRARAARSAGAARRTGRRRCRAARERAHVRATASSIEGVGNLLTQLARCCQPLPGDAIAGYITRGRGVGIHREGCAARAPRREASRRG